MASTRNKISNNYWLSLTFVNALIWPSLWNKNFIKQLPGAPKPNVVIRIIGRLIQIQRKRTCVRSVVPIATPKENTRTGAEVDFTPTILNFNMNSKK